MRFDFALLPRLSCPPRDVCREDSLEIRWRRMRAYDGIVLPLRNFPETRTRYAELLPFFRYSLCLAPAVARDRRSLL